MGISYASLVLEVTRRCNMRCAHCLRGEAQDKDIPFETIDRALEDVTEINELTFTGGEPTLNLPAMKYALEACKRNEINVRGYFIATNGKLVTDEFLLFVMDLHAYVLSCTDGYDEEGFCAVALSEDDFHEDVPDMNRYRLMALKSFSDIKRMDWGGNPHHKLIARGRALGLKDYDTRPPMTHNDPGIEKTDDSRYWVENTVLVTVNGDIVTDCDYEFIDAPYVSIGNLNEKSATDIFDEYLDGEWE